MEREGPGVDAIPQPRRIRTVIEDVSQVGAAVRALDLGPPHEQAVVRLLLHALFLNGRPETRPPGSGVELRLRGKELSAADHTDVDTRLVVVPVFSAERSLGPLVDADLELQRRKPQPKFRLVELLHEETRTPEPFKALARRHDRG